MHYARCLDRYGQHPRCILYEYLYKPPLCFHCELELPSEVTSDNAGPALLRAVDQRTRKTKHPLAHLPQAAPSRGKQAAPHEAAGQLQQQQDQQQQRFRLQLPYFAKEGATTPAAQPARALEAHPKGSPTRTRQDFPSPSDRSPGSARAPAPAASAPAARHPQPRSRLLGLRGSQGDSRLNRAKVKRRGNLIFN